MNAVVIDASAGAEIVANTGRGHALIGLLPAGAEGWVPQHFYAEVLAALRRMTVIDRKLTEAQATQALARLTSWHLHQVSVPPLLRAAWTYRDNLTAGDALYAVLAGELQAPILTDDRRFANSPAMTGVARFLTLPVR